jgi:hypothetical protein
MGLMVLATEWRELLATAVGPVGLGDVMLLMTAQEKAHLAFPQPLVRGPWD